MDVAALNSMLQEATIEEDKQQVVRGSCLNPSSIIVSKHSKTEVNDGKEKEVDKGAIWDPKEVETKLEADMKTDDGRKRPEFDILFKQCVGSEDVYLGMGDMDPSSNSCSHIVIKIKLPGEEYKDLELDVKRETIYVSSPQYKLITYLPYPVDEGEGKAKWFRETNTLSVTLPVLRD